MTGRHFILLTTFLCLGLLISACSPSLSPLYRDYRTVSSDTSKTVRIKTALKEAGWAIANIDASTRVIETKPRTFNDWILYEMQVTLGVVPINDQYVRLFIHPRRQYIFGGRTKLAFLKDRLRDDVIPPLNEAFSNHGFKIVSSRSKRAQN